MQRHISISRSSSRRWLAVLTLSAIAAFFLAACGGNSSGSDSDAPAEDGPAAPPAAVLALDSESILHHWQALTAVSACDIEDARHHVAHIMEIVQGDHLAAMHEVDANLVAGNLHDAGHTIEAMLAGRTEPALTPFILQAQLALDALGRDDAAAAVHHVEHAAALDGEQEMHHTQAIVADLHASRTDNARAALRDLIAEVVGHDAQEQAQIPDHDDENAHADVAREIVVVMRDFSFDPNQIRVKVGETVRLRMINDGTVLHDITAVDFTGQAQGEGADLHEHNGHAAASIFHTAANPSDTATLVFTATQAGEFSLFCSVPGHQELGMVATLIVEW